jgi:hypothetical protein
MQPSGPVVGLHICANANGNAEASQSVRNAGGSRGGARSEQRSRAKEVEWRGDVRQMADPTR